MLARLLHPFRHWWLCITGTRCAWRWSAMLMLYLAASVAVMDLRYLPPTSATSETAAPVEQVDISLLPDQLSQEDAARYQIIYTAQQRGDFDAADNAIAQLENSRLLGNVLAARYLDSRYHADTAEIKAWLARYADHPEVAAITQLAIREGMDVRVAAADEPLRGEGYTDHLGRASMPDVWYTALSLWREGNAAQAQPLFEQIGQNDSLSEWHRAAGYYWAYRSATRAGETSDAKHNLALAANYPTTFYGQLAGDHLDAPALTANAPEVRDHLRGDQRSIRAALLAQLGRTEDAENELRHLYSDLPRAQRPGVVTLASELGLANLQVRMARMPQLSRAEALFASYPMPPVIVGESAIADPALLLAIARNESSFRQAVTSSGGAVGMMQMLPSTARAVEQRVGGLALASADADTGLIADRLTDPATSVRYAAHYLNILKSKPIVGNNLVRLLAAYNAGPGAVLGWQAAAQTVEDPLLYIESIPYAETRNYVKQVMAQYWIYQQIRDQAPASRSAITQGKWPTV